LRIYTAIAVTLLTLVVMPAAASAREVGHIRVAIDGAATFNDYAKTAQRHGYVILQAWQQDRLHALKAANPAVKVLVYKNLSFTSNTSQNGYSPSGVNYAQANRDNPDWFLRNTSGQRFNPWGYSWNWAMDVGNAGYQARWAKDVLAELRSQGWDGVFMDDVNPTMKYHYDAAKVAKYPTDAAYSAATRSALAAITPSIRASGKVAVANIGAWSAYYSTGTDWLRYLDGAMDEMFLKWGNAVGEGYDPSRWQTQVKEIKEAARQGKDFIGITHSGQTDAQAARYGYATMMLATSGGHAQFALTHDYSQETWFPEYDYDLGAPTGADTLDSNGVYRRRFERGLVLVNPTSQAKHVNFGAPYRGSGVARATSTDMAPTSGLVLLADEKATPGTVRASAPAASAASAVPAVLAVVKGRGLVEVRWTRGRHGIRSYRVVRNGKVVGTTRGRSVIDRSARAGRHYRYRVTALDKHGRRVGSRMTQITTASGERSSSSLTHLVRGSLAASDLRGWRSAYVERRTRVSGKLRWLRVSRVTRPRSSMRLAIRVPRSAVVRLVVRPARGRDLRSTAIRVAAA
jgi:hypothetical protein